MNIEMSIEARGIIDLHLSSELRKKKIDLEVCYLKSILRSLSLSLSSVLSLITVATYTYYRRDQRFRLEKLSKIWTANLESIGMYVSVKDSHTT